MGLMVDEINGNTVLYEWRAVYHENNMRQSLGLPLRIGYGKDMRPEAEYPVRTIMLENNNNNWSIMFPPKLPWFRNM